MVVLLTPRSYGSAIFSVDINNADEFQMKW